MNLGAFLMTAGHHIAARRHPEARRDANVSVDHFIHLAKLAESAKFDALFLTDSVGARDRNVASLSHRSRPVTFEPLTLLLALSTVMERIGPIATATTTFNEPFNIARKFAFRPFERRARRLEFGDFAQRVGSPEFQSGSPRCVR